MASYDQVLELARQLSAAEQQRLALELGAGRTAVQLGMLADRPPSPHSVAWVKSERGHAVLATDTGPTENDIPTGGEAIAGMWADARGEQP
jgi:hypothetical protein